MGQYHLNEDRYFHLDFFGKVIVDLPLSVDFASRYQEAVKPVVDMGGRLEPGQVPNSTHIYETVMTAIDNILGDGMADKIADCYPNNGADFDGLDGLDVLAYIMVEYNEAMQRRTNRSKTNLRVGSVAMGSQPTETAPMRHKQRG